jgi:hypothetical protein
VLGTGGQLNFRDVNSSSMCSENSAQSTLTSLPSSWSNGAGWNSCSLSAYISGTTSGGSTVSAPVATTLPAISGQALRGQTVTSTTGTWSNSPSSVAYKWEDCDASGANCAAISGASGSSYVLVSADLGHTVRVVVTAANSAGSGSATAAQTATVSGSTTSAPVDTVLPAIGGQALRGQTLTSTTGTWSNSPSSVAYKWEDCDASGANCAAISGATGSSYVLASADVGHTIRVVVTGTNSGGSASATSAQTAAVSAPNSTCTTTLNPASLGSSPYPAAALESALQSAAGGSTICLSSGTAGQIDLYSVSPSSNVTVQPASGATVYLGNIDVGANTHNVTFTGFSGLGGVGIGSSGASCCTNLSFTHDTFTGESYVRNVVNSNIMFAHDTFNNINECSGCFEGRIEVVSSSGSQPDGVTIENSIMSGGNTDGVQDHGSGTQILDNEFANIIESNCGGIHCDAIQTVGATGTVIAGNYFHNTTDCFLMDDGGANITIKNNECGPMASDSSFWIQFGGISGITFTHNTITGTTAGSYGTDNGNPSSNVTWTNNIEYSTPSLNPGQSLSGTTTEDYNLVQSCTAPLCGGSHDIKGLPTFVGGAQRSTWAGFALASGSLGLANASDGLNRGISSFAVTPGS